MICLKLKLMTHSLCIIFIILVFTSCVGSGGGGSTGSTSANTQSNITASNEKDINGGWSNWQVYKDCQSISTTPKRMIRFCNNPIPKGKNGKPCEGEDKKTISCSSVPTFSAWEKVGTCDPKTGMQKYKRICTQDGVETQTCVGEYQKNENCPIDGVLLPAQKISNCDANTGTEMWLSVCQHSLNGGKTCYPDGDHDKTEFRVCDVLKLGFTAWTKSGSCVNGRQLMVRQCTGTPESCAVGLLQMTVSCTDTSVGNWGNWYTDLATCKLDTGLAVERRVCLSGSCTGANERAGICVVNCTYNPYRNLGQCADGITEIKRIRSILYPARNGGTPCNEALEETILCPVDCKITSQWKKKTECDDYGKYTVERVYIEAFNGGVACPVTKESRIRLCPKAGLNSCSWTN
jgi:hypothetical protein